MGGGPSAPLRGSGLRDWCAWRLHLTEEPKQDIANAKVAGLGHGMTSSAVRVAVVEDDSSVCKGVGRLLRSYWFEVRLFNSAEAFLAVIDDVLPGCLILDIQLGGMNGLALLDELWMRGVTVPTVIITARENVNDPRVTFDWRSKPEAIPCLRKPFNAESLLEAVKSVLS